MKKFIRALLIYTTFILFFLYGGTVFSQVKFYSFEEAEQDDATEEYEIRFYSPEEGEQQKDIGKHDENDKKDEKKEKKDHKENSVIFPDGGEILLIGNTYYIRWDFEKSIENVSLYFSTNRGLTWETIVEDTSNDGAFLWVVPPIISGDCLVKVRHAEKWEPSDASNNIFSISARANKVLEQDKMLEQDKVQEQDWQQQ
jgi:hypothetical protein